MRTGMVGQDIKTKTDEDEDESDGEGVNLSTTCAATAGPRLGGTHRDHYADTRRISVGASSHRRRASGDVPA